MPRNLAYSATLRKGTWRVYQVTTWYGARQVEIRLYWRDKSRIPRLAYFFEDELGAYQTIIRHSRNSDQSWWKVLPLLIDHPRPPESVETAAWEACHDRNWPEEGQL